MAGESGHKACFGELSRVFPVGEDGLRSSPETCLACPHKTGCLKAALNSRDGLRLKEERLDRALGPGRMGFIGRWSQKKLLSRMAGDTGRKSKA